MTTATDCRYCIDGHTPAGSDTDLGPLFERCPACIPACLECHGLAVFPADYDCPFCLIAALFVQRLGPVFCPGCTGVIAVIPLDPDPEVTP